MSVQERIAPNRGSVAAPTEDAPERGAVCWYDVILGEAIRFEDDDGTHVIRSTEFDVYGEGDSLQEALANFHEHAEALFVYLSELTQEGEATDHERQIALLVGSRIVEAYQNRDAKMREQSVARALVDAALGSRRRQQGLAFCLPTRQPTSSHALVA